MKHLAPPSMLERRTSWRDLWPIGSKPRDAREQAIPPTIRVATKAGDAGTD